MKTRFLYLILMQLVIVFAMSGVLTVQSADSPLVILAEKVERPNSHEMRFSIKLVNHSAGRIALTSINLDKPKPFPVFLEQWHGQKGWEIVAPCVDIAPPDVMSLEPGQSIAFDYVLSLPQRDCKGRQIQFEGTFRYRIDYFETENQAKIYIKSLFSSRGEPIKPSFVVSKVFIPPTPFSRQPARVPHTSRVPHTGAGGN